MALFLTCCLQVCHLLTEPSSWQQSMNTIQRPAWSSSFEQPKKIFCRLKTQKQVAGAVLVRSEESKLLIYRVLVAPLKLVHLFMKCFMQLASFMNKIVTIVIPLFVFLLLILNLVSCSVKCEGCWCRVLNFEMLRHFEFVLEIFKNEL